MTANTDIVDQAKTWLGVPYQYGGVSKAGVDCSGFVQSVHAAVGIKIPRDTVTQMAAAKMFHNYTDTQPGDCVYFGDPNSGGPNQHVGIIVGGGAMIDAPHTGASVRYDPILTFGEHILGYARFWDGSMPMGATEASWNVPGTDFNVPSPGDVTGQLGAVVKAITDLASWPVKVGEWLVKPHNIIRIVEFLIGGFALFMGVYMVNADTINDAVGKVAKTATKTAEVAAI